MEKKTGDLEGLAETSGEIMEKEAESTSKAPAEATKSHDAAQAEDIPDPDEDDLDDLDGTFLLLSYETKGLTYLSRYAR